MKARMGEALRALLLAPLTLIVWVPLFLWVEDILQGHRPELRMVGAIPLALMFWYVGMAIFGVPLYVAMVLPRKTPALAFVIANIVGAIAALVTPQLTEMTGSWDIAIGNLRTLASNPSMWIDAISIAGAAVGVTFWLLTRGAHVDAPHVHGSKV